MGGFLGGSSKSSSSSSSEVNDRRIAGDNGSIIVTEGAQLDFLSDDAFKEALNFANAESTDNRSLLSDVIAIAFDSANENASNAFSTISEAQGQAFSQTNSALEAQRSEGLQGFKQFLVAGVAVAAITAGAVVLRGKKIL